MPKTKRVYLTATGTVCDVGDPEAVSFRERVTADDGTIIARRSGVIIDERKELAQHGGQ